jgi:hypothetical protein
MGTWPMENAARLQSPASRIKGGLVLALSTVVLAVACAGGGGEAPAGPSQPPSSPPSTWLTYVNQQYGFTFSYPREYVVIQPAPDPRQTAVFRIWFQDASLANAPMEPPKFAADVYENAVGLTLDAWLAAVANPSRYDRETVQVGGNQGVRVRDRANLIPGVFYYIARNGFVYRFTPIGQLADEMVATVTFTR